MADSDPPQDPSLAALNTVEPESLSAASDVDHTHPNLDNNPITAALLLPVASEESRHPAVHVQLLRDHYMFIASSHLLEQRPQGSSHALHHLA